jgi:hypothetical protein
VLSFLGPVRRLDTSPGEPGFDVRWDIIPGADVFGDTISVQDLSLLLTVSPPMFGGARAFDGPSCN